MVNEYSLSLFITGANGFVGRQLVKQLAVANYRKVYCLCRRMTPFFASIALQHPHVEIIRGDLHDFGSYRRALENSDIAVHLAAVTGKADPNAYFRVNTEGTALFTEQCRLAGVRGLIYFSTIAVNFGDLSNYPYARSKQAAEAIIRNSGLPYTILRPTIIFGIHSPIWQNFLTMARAPYPFVFGNGRTRIQPIHVDELIGVVLDIIKGERFDHGAHDLGGADIISIEALVRKIRQRCTGQTVQKVLHVPVAPLIFLLRRLEPLILDSLPFTSGQLTSFIDDGIASRDTAIDIYRPHQVPLDKMVDDLVQETQSEAARADLSIEGRKLAQRLMGFPPSDLAIDKYVRAHQQGLIDSVSEASWFQKILCRAARVGPLFYLAEAYSAVFLRSGLLRKKLVLMAAILECLPDSSKIFDEPESGSLSSFGFGLLIELLKTGVALIISLPIFLPLHLLSGISVRRSVKRL